MSRHNRRKCRPPRWNWVCSHVGNKPIYLSGANALFSEQLESDIAGEKEQLEEAKEGIEALRNDLEQLTNDIAASEVSQNVAERIYSM